MNKGIRSAALAFLAAGILGLPPAWAQSPALSPDKMPVTELTAGLHVIKAEVASTEAQRQRGLMHREKMGPNEGMLFVFDAPAHVCMWMKNTLIPLSVAFIDDGGKIVNIEDMAPQTLTSHCGRSSVRYALEMNRGWFRQRKIAAGAEIRGLPTGR